MKNEKDVGSNTITGFKIILEKKGTPLLLLQLNNQKDKYGIDTYNYLMFPKLLSKLKNELSKK